MDLAAFRWGDSTLYSPSGDELALTLRYVAAGLLNSLLGLSFIALLSMGFGLAPFEANAGGFLAGYLTGYALHRYFTFRSSVPHGRALATYLIVIAIGYAVNLAVLVLLIRLGISGMLAQVAAVAAYVVVTFLLSRHFVFRRLE